MRVSTAFFTGVGTVVIAIAAGLGGGLLLGDIMSPQQPKHPSSEVTRLEQRASPQPIPAMNGATQPVPYMASTQAATTVAEQPPQPQQQETPPQQVQPQVQQVSTQPTQPKQQPEPNKAAQPAAAAAQPATSAEQPAARANSEDSLAKARDADLRRDARRPEDRDRRKAERRQQWGEGRQQWDERRQQWVEKRKWRQREGDDLADVEASVRDATESRPSFAREPRFESREPRRDPGFFGNRDSGPGGGRFTLFDD
jgi:hypothetical protein